MLYESKGDMFTSEIVEFLENYDMYCNQNGIEISYHSHGQMMITSPWPGADQDPTFDLKLVMYSIAPKEFIQLFSIQSVIDFESIKPRALTHFYELGKAAVSAVLVRPEDCYSIEYWKLDKMVLFIDDAGVKHKAKTKLKSLLDYKQHSYRHFGLSEY